MKNLKKIKRQFHAIESMAMELRSNLAEVDRHIADEQTVNAFHLLKGTWPSVIFVTHRRFTGSTKATVRPSTALIQAMADQNLPADLREQLREADIVAVMGNATASNVRLLLSASLSALDVTEPATLRGTSPAKSPTDRRPSGRLTRWAAAAAGLFSATS